MSSSSYCCKPVVFLSWSVFFLASNLILCGSILPSFNKYDMRSTSVLVAAFVVSPNKVKSKNLSLVGGASSSRTFTTFTTRSFFKKDESNADCDEISMSHQFYTTSDSRRSISAGAETVPGVDHCDLATPAAPPSVFPTSASFFDDNSGKNNSDYLTESDNDQMKEKKGDYKYDEDDNSDSCCETSSYRKTITELVYRRSLHRMLMNDDDDNDVEKRMH